MGEPRQIPIWVCILNYELSDEGVYYKGATKFLLQVCSKVIEHFSLVVYIGYG